MALAENFQVQGFSPLRVKCGAVSHSLHAPKMAELLSRHKNISYRPMWLHYCVAQVMQWGRNPAGPSPESESQDNNRRQKKPPQREWYHSISPLHWGGGGGGGSTVGQTTNNPHVQGPHVRETYTAAECTTTLYEASNISIKPPRLHNNKRLTTLLKSRWL